MNNTKPLQDDFNSLFEGLDVRLEALEGRQKARQEILHALENGHLQEALDLAKQADLVLLDDPAFSSSVLKYWSEAQKHYQSLSEEAQDMRKEVGDIRDAAEVTLHSLQGVAQGYQTMSALVSAEHALRQLDLESLRRHLDRVSDSADLKSRSRFEHDWYRRMREDLQWLEAEEESTENWQNLIDIKEVLQTSRPLEKPARELLELHRNSYLISLWEQQDALIRLNRRDSQQYIFEINDLQRITTRVEAIKAQMDADKHTKPSRNEAEQLWRLLHRLEDHLLGLPPDFFETNDKLVENLAGTLKSIVELLKVTEKLSKRWPSRRRKDWDRYLQERMSFLQQCLPVSNPS